MRPWHLPRTTIRLASPSRIGHYRIEDRLGAGGMGVVYRAWDEALRRPLAVKRLRRGGRHRPAPLPPRGAGRPPQPPAIVHIYEIVESDEGDWIVMELVEGNTLPAARASAPAGLLTVRLAREIAEGLAEAHAQGIVHRDSRRPT